MSQTYADLAHERDDLKSENETLRSIMDKMLERGNELKAENEQIRQNSVTHETHRVLVEQARRETAEQILQEIVKTKLCATVNTNNELANYTNHCICSMLECLEGIIKCKYGLETEKKENQDE